MLLGSPAPVAAKVANVGPTPLQYRRKDGTQKDDMQIATPASKSALEGAKSSRDAIKEGGEEETMNHDGGGINFDDAQPTSPSPIKTEESKQQKGEEGEPSN